MFQILLITLITTFLKHVNYTHFSIACAQTYVILNVPFEKKESKFQHLYNIALTCCDADVFRIQENKTINIITK